MTENSLSHVRANNGYLLHTQEPGLKIICKVMHLICMTNFAFTHNNQYESLTSAIVENNGRVL